MLLIGTDTDIDLLVVAPPMSGSESRRMRTWPFTLVSWVGAGLKL